MCSTLVCIVIRNIGMHIIRNIGMHIIRNIGMHIYKNNFHLFKNIETVKKTELVRIFKRKF
jgi:hypothetical protein